MVAVYGTLPREAPIVASATRSKAARAVTAVAILALCTVAVVVVSSSAAAQRTELYPYEKSALHDNVDGIWSSPDEAWEGIDTVLPTAATAWQDPSSAAGWNLTPPGQLAARQLAGFCSL